MSAASPQTLLAIAGRTMEPARLSESAVVVIDAQRVYTDGRLPLVGIDAAMDELAAVLARARSAGTPIIHILQQGPSGSPICAVDSPDVEPAPQASPMPGEIIIPKSLPSSFYNTNLSEKLKEIGRNKLIVVGFMTHMCVSTTVRDAIEHGCFSTIVAGATATRDLQDGHGGVVPAADVQKAHLAALADRFAVVVPTAGHLQD